MRMKVFDDMRVWDGLQIPARFNKNRKRYIEPDNPARMRRIIIDFLGRYESEISINPENKYPD